MKRVGKRKDRREAKRKEYERQQQELALALKMMIMEGIVPMYDPDRVHEPGYLDSFEPEYQSELDRGMLGNIIGDIEGNPMYTVRPYYMMDDGKHMVIARNSPDGKEVYSSRIPIEDVMKAQFPLPNIQKKPIPAVRKFK